MSDHVASVIIPAHNEAAVIERCLTALRTGAPPGALEIVVVCNGCTDATAQLARSASVTVLETPQPGKARALNLGDEMVSAFPRFYVDADVEVTGHALMAVAAALRDGRCLAAAPRVVIDPTGTSRLVRGYHRIWSRLPYVTADHIGSGVVGLSEAGRARFVSFPAAIADDYFLYALFVPGERRTVSDVTFTVFPARTTRDLVRRKTRVFAGNIEMRRAGHATAPKDAVTPSDPRPGTETAAAVRTSVTPTDQAHQPVGEAEPGTPRRVRPTEKDSPAGNLLSVVASDWTLLTALPAYVGISVVAKVLARRKVARGDLGSWERDESSRIKVG
ncbi:MULTISPECIES: glycosyltransferase [unclassified Pseudofrankia]|uniref:glycosyltransferase n=1 Tax=unclassified Pseudofrankia TaxID=2994372 RepID=UPI0009F31512|nr:MULTISPECIES: glycosyltransferase family 2 protein [unclassified Pseudofrankia]MDT3443502.1 glycosyltransferase family 2 protein [Pseudofrankia sp. BMG5.37]